MEKFFFFNHKQHCDEHLVTGSLCTEIITLNPGRVLLRQPGFRNKPSGRLCGQQLCLEGFASPAAWSTRDLMVGCDRQGKRGSSAIFHGTRLLLSALEN